MVPEPETHEVRRVLDRLPEVECIEDKELRAEVIRVLATAPEYFWDVPATTTDEYHHPNTRGTHGLWLHTKMVFTAYERIAQSWEQMGYITDDQLDYGRAACLLHDLLKNGYPADHPEHDPENDHEGSVDDHDVLMADYIRDHTDLPEDVARAVAAHMGDWYDGPSPAEQTPEDFFLGLLIHTADLVASTSNITVGVHDLNDTLANKYPSIPRATFE